MDARNFIKISVRSLGLRISNSSSAAAPSGVVSYSCEIKLHNFPVQKAPVPLVLTDFVSSTDSSSRVRRNSSGNSSNLGVNKIAASFYLDETDLKRLLDLPCFKISSHCLEIVVVSGSQGVSCGLGAGKHIGSLKIKVSQEWVEGRRLEVHHGWASIGRKRVDGKGPSIELHASVTVEPDPRYVFQFDGEPALNSLIIQSHGSIRQPIFSCKFTGDRSSRSGFDDAFNGWTISSSGEKTRGKKERKGWLVMIHDLSGSPVAAASMVTPFVPSSGSNYVSRSNPGAWLILRPEPGGLLRSESGGVTSWCPWGRLEAWREQGLKGGLGCRFQIVPDGGGMNGVRDGILISETVICTRRGGNFLIDRGKGTSGFSFPVDSPGSSGDFSFNMSLSSISGFVMSCRIQGKGRSNKKRIKPVVQLAARHVSCVEDAAVFMALAAAVDLSMDACQSFTRKLRKELSDAVSST
ncbi:hypothetical protein KP509_06G078800 [Ceratopteris richardii]|uniref:Uncharacterized protein n=1 Tax=Ceratopteris richardii TaxID=49495 RepID=A0A8T2UK10_CERRI|nr:hypothetical protein KP509_06G078800 [Ceratopteris richardii]